MGFVASWGGQVPAVLLLTKWWRNDLFGLYTGMAIGYAMLAVLYSVIVLRRQVKPLCCYCDPFFVNTIIYFRKSNSYDTDI